MNAVLIYAISLIAGYLSGSVMFACIITRLVLGKDIRTLGNKNPGAANTFINVGPVWGILAGLLDASKALIPMLIGYYFFRLSTLPLGLFGLGAVFGHGFPLYFGFRGGRSAGTIIGLYMFFIPYELIVSFAIIPTITLTIIKVKPGFWTPFGIITLSSLSALFFSHPLEIKILVIAGGFAGLFMNRNNLSLMVRKLTEKIAQRIEE
ncbi:glycerol-3-phosphate acyltransferase [bacterium]|nr:glycerol-3-phosphate acyltransferase [bacterium]